MSATFAWFLAGLLLVIAELVSGTFHLLIFGLAAIVGALASFLGAPFWLQAGVAGVAALAGTWLIHRRRRTLHGAGRGLSIDRGQSAVFETWLDAAARVARVRYRGAPWEADVDEAADPAAGATLYVTAIDGARLKVSSRRP